MSSDAQNTAGTADAVGITDELLAVSETAAFGQASALTLQIDDASWVSTDDYNPDESDPDKTDSLTTSDIDNQLNASAERANAKRKQAGDSLYPEQGNAPVLSRAERDIDDVLDLRELDRIVAGVASNVVPQVRPEDRALLDKQARSNGFFYRKA
jgi:hypothetical protein